MEGLLSPPNRDDSTILHFDMDPKLEMARFHSTITPTVYFYSEDDTLWRRMFPPAWYAAMGDLIAEDLSPDEQPCHEVSPLQN